jgi:hypothetical protein
MTNLIRAVPNQTPLVARTARSRLIVATFGVLAVAPAASGWGCTLPPHARVLAHTPQVRAFTTDRPHHTRSLWACPRAGTAVRVPLGRPGWQRQVGQVKATGHTLALVVNRSRADPHQPGAFQSGGDLRVFNTATRRTIFAVRDIGGDLPNPSGGVFLDDFALSARADLAWISLVGVGPSVIPTLYLQQSHARRRRIDSGAIDSLAINSRRLRWHTNGQPHTLTLR